MNIGEVLTRSWDILWKNKILFVFGLLAGLAGGSGGNNFRFNFQQASANHLPVHFPAWALGLLVMAGLVLFVVLIVLGTLGRAGLVRGAWLADGGETGLRFSRLFQEGSAYFGRVFLLGLLVFAFSLALVFVLLIPVILTLGIGLICLMPFFCLLVPFFIALTVIVELAIVAIVGEDLSVMDSLRRAWEIFRDHLPEIIAIGLVVVILSTVVGFFASLPLIAILAPAIGVFYSGAGQFAAGRLLLALFMFILYLPILLTFQAVITSYVETTWTLTFRRLTGRLTGRPASVL
jgi:hypothetical protein